MLIPEYARWLERNLKSDETRKNYLAKARFFLAWLKKSEKDVAEIGSEDIHKFMEYLLIERKAAPATRSNYLLALREYFNFLMSKGLFKENPTAKIPLPKLRPVPPGALSEDEISRMMFACVEKKNEFGFRDLAIIAFLAGTGCRIGALTRLQLSDFQSVKIFMPDRCPRCEQSLISGSHAGRGREVQATQVTVKEKGGFSWPILLHDKINLYLQAYLTSRKTGTDSDIVFPAKRNGKVGPMQRAGIREMLKRRAEQAGITRPITPHAFRHSAITFWLDSGVDPETVQRYVGHKNLKVTLSYRNKSMRSFVNAGISRGRNLLDGRVKTPLDLVLDRIL